LVEPIGSFIVAEKSKKAKRGAPTRKKGKKNRMKKAPPRNKKSVEKKPALKHTPIPLAPAPLLGSFGGKAEDQ